MQDQKLKKRPKASLFHALSHILYTVSQNITSSLPNNFLLVITSLVDLEVAFTKGFLQGSQRPKYGSRPSNIKAIIVLSSNWHCRSKILPIFWKVKMVLLHQILFNQSDYIRLHLPNARVYTKRE